MKKKIVVLMTVLTLIAAVLLFTACSGEDSDELTVTSYEITETKVNVGDAHGTPSITANMSDGTTKTVSNNLVYDQEDLDKLELDADKKYTKAGVYEVKVYIIEQKDELFIGVWKITVRAVK